MVGPVLGSTPLTSCILQQTPVDIGKLWPGKRQAERTEGLSFLLCVFPLKTSVSLVL